MILKSVSAAIAALAFLYATPSQASFNGNYLATFTFPGSTFQHCFHLHQDGAVPGYRVSGKWKDTDFPGTKGQFVVFQNVLHLAGYVSENGETDSLSIDGQLSSGSIVHATFDLFTSTGLYLSAGSVTETRNPDCRAP